MRPSFYLLVIFFIELLLFAGYAGVFQQSSLYQRLDIVPDCHYETPKPIKIFSNKTFEGRKYKIYREVPAKRVHLDYAHLPKKYYTDSTTLVQLSPLEFTDTCLVRGFIAKYWETQRYFEEKDESQLMKDKITRYVRAVSDSSKVVDSYRVVLWVEMYGRGPLPFEEHWSTAYTMDVVVYTFLILVALVSLLWYIIQKFRW
jgi:hypothetical protein